MDSNKLSAIAYLIVVSVSKKRSQALFDYSRHKFHSFSFSSNGNSVNIFDYTRHCYLSGILPNIYDYGTRSYIMINIRDSHFDGYDYETHLFFSGSVSGNIININASGRNYNFSLS